MSHEYCVYLCWKVNAAKIFSSPLQWGAPARHISGTATWDRHMEMWLYLRKKIFHAEEAQRN
jgi:hypothetical protein